MSVNGGGWVLDSVMVGLIFGESSTLFTHGVSRIDSQGAVDGSIVTTESLRNVGRRESRAIYYRSFHN